MNFKIIEESYINSYSNYEEFIALIKGIFENEIDNIEYIVNLIGELKPEGLLLYESLPLGLMVRARKLEQSILDYPISEVSMLFITCCFETLINLEYILNDLSQSDRLIGKYIRSSFYREKKLQSLVQENVNNRDGLKIDLEKRILASIEHYESMIGFTVAGLSKKKDSKWLDNKMNEPEYLTDRAKALKKSKSFIYQNIEYCKRYLHPSWTLMYEHNLDYKGDFYEIKSQDAFYDDYRHLVDIIYMNYIGFYSLIKYFDLDNLRPDLYRQIDNSIFHNINMIQKIKSNVPLRIINPSN